MLMVIKSSLIPFLLSFNGYYEGRTHILVDSIEHCHEVARIELNLNHYECRTNVPQETIHTYYDRRTKK